MKAPLALLVCAGALQSAETLPFVPEPFAGKIELPALGLREMRKEEMETAPNLFPWTFHPENLRSRQGARESEGIRILVPRSDLDPKMVHTPGNPGIDYKLRIVPTDRR